MGVGTGHLGHTRVPASGRGLGETLQAPGSGPRPTSEISQAGRETVQSYRPSLTL